MEKSVRAAEIAGLRAARYYMEVNGKKETAVERVQQKSAYESPRAVGAPNVVLVTKPSVTARESGSPTKKRRRGIKEKISALHEEILHLKHAARVARHEQNYKNAARRIRGKNLRDYKKSLTEGRKRAHDFYKQKFIEFSRVAIKKSYRHLEGLSANLRTWKCPECHTWGRYMSIKHRQATRGERNREAADAFCDDMEKWMDGLGPHPEKPRLLEDQQEEYAEKVLNKYYKAVDHKGSSEPEPPPQKKAKSVVASERLAAIRAKNARQGEDSLVYTYTPRPAMDDWEIRLREFRDRQNP